MSAKSFLLISFFALLNLAFSNLYAQDTAAHRQISGTSSIIKLIKPINKSNIALGISAKTIAKLKSEKNAPINIALFAVDRRKPAEAGNSDVVMIISINQLNGNFKMASIMRDTYVKIEGRGMDKINAAYALGGPQLAIKTINQNFDMDIRDYVNVDFYTAARIINSVGGLEINVKTEEIKYLNNYLDELAIYEKIPAVYVKEAGLQNLSGKQTVAYTRIRYVGNGDYDRTERQRAVLITLFKKMRESGKAIMPAFIKDILPNIETSMSNMMLLNFGSSILYSNNKTIQQDRFPLDAESHGKRINNTWYLIADIKATTSSLHSFLQN